jgi:hypothetical protein
VAAAARELLPWRDEHERRYFWYLRRLLDYTREQLTCDALAEYFVSRFPHLRRATEAKILMLTGHSGVNYSRELLAIGLRQRYGARFVEVPKLEVLYKTCANPGAYYGCGFTYSALLEDDPAIDRSGIARASRSASSTSSSMAASGQTRLRSARFRSFPSGTTCRRAVTRTASPLSMVATLRKTSLGAPTRSPSTSSTTAASAPASSASFATRGPGDRWMRSGAAA